MSTETSAPSSLPMAMSAPLGVRVRAQGYVFSRRDALEFGTPDEQLRAWHASGEVQRGSQGVYFVPGAKRASTTTDDETSQHRLRATLLALGEGYSLPISPLCWRGRYPRAATAIPARCTSAAPETGGGHAGRAFGCTACLAEPM